MLKVISLWAGPGAGKSTTAASLFAEMKRLRYQVELVTEVAKDLTYEQSWKRLGNQLQVLSKQNFRLERLRDSVEWAITDSPLPLSLIYCPEQDKEWLAPLVQRLWDSYDNYPFVLQRTAAPYQEFGRNQNLVQAKEIDTLVHALAEEFNPLLAVNPDEAGVERRIIAQINHLSSIRAGA